MKTLKITALLIAYLASASALAQQQGVYTQWLSVSTTMNWSSGMITAEGFGVAPENKREQVGKLLACRAAVTDAQRNLLEATKGVKVTVDSSISKMASQYDTVKTAVEGTIRGASILERTMVEDGTCKVVMGMFIGGKVTESIYQQAIEKTNSFAHLWDKFWQGELAYGFFSKAVAAQAKSDVSLQPLRNSEFDNLDQRVSKLESSLLTINPALADAKTEQQPSGLIIDVRGYRFLPSMTPVLRQQNGNIVYPSSKDKETLIASGKLLSLFSKSLEFAMNHPIIGDKPLLIKASADSSSPTNIKLNSQNAAKLIELARQNFFETPKIIIVLD
jgi:hypothetical protein